MAHISRSRPIAARPQEIWDVLADFGSLSSWVDAVDHSCITNQGPGGGPVGTTRRVQMGRNVLLERIIEFEPPTALTYAITGLPRRFGRVTNGWTLRPTTDATEVTLTSTVEIGSGPAARLAERAVVRVVATQTGGLLAGLAHRMENSHA